MFDLAPGTALSLLTLIGLAVGLALQRWQLGRLHARLSLLEQRSLVADQAAGALQAQVAACRVRSQTLPQPMRGRRPDSPSCAPVSSAGDTGDG